MEQVSGVNGIKLAGISEEAYDKAEQILEWGSLAVLFLGIVNPHLYYTESNNSWDIAIYNNSFGKSNSQKLGRNLIKSGVQVPNYPCAAHHIIAGNAKLAEPARTILARYGIDINDAVNGVFLPIIKGVTVATYHPSIHTNAYYVKVNEILMDVTSKEDLLCLLEFIATELLNGTFI